MLYEIRLYAIPPGRISDIERRMLRDVPALFAEHGMRAVAHWSVLAGPNLPAFLYVLEWKDEAERQACWENFYGDGRWWQIRSRSNAGSELVESYGLWLMQPNGTKRKPCLPLSEPTEGEIHELMLHDVAIGQSTLVTSRLEEVLLPLLEQVGGKILAVLDMVAGPRLPSLAIFVAWPDFSSRAAGRRKFEELDDSKIAAGTSLLGRSDVYLLQPMAPRTELME
jgi:hypothetical protein